MNASHPIFFLAIFSVAACSAGRAPDAPHTTGACETLAERCARGGCDTFDVAAARARQPQSEGSFYRYRIGTCGEYRFISVQEGMGMGTEYFAADGTLVASTSIADAPVCKDAYGVTQGRIPTCTENTTESHDWSVPAKK